MSVAKIAISIDDQLLRQLDRLMEEKKLKTRSQAIQVAVSEAIMRLKYGSLEAACEQLDRNEEQTLAEEWCEGDVDSWEEF